MTSAGVDDCDDEENTDIITIHFLTQREPETVVRVKQRSDRPRRYDKDKIQKNRMRKEELLASSMGASPRSSMSSLCQSYSRLPDSQSGSWMNLGKLNSLLGSTESVATVSHQPQFHQQQPQQQQSQQQPSQPAGLQQPDFLSSLFDKLSGSLAAVTEATEEQQQQQQYQQQVRDQERLTYTVFNVTAKRFKDSPSSPPKAGAITSRGCSQRPPDEDDEALEQLESCQEDSALDDFGLEGEADVDEEVAAVAGAEETEGAAGEERPETPEIVRFLWAHQAKCWPEPVTNGSAGQFGHPIFKRPATKSHRCYPEDQTGNGGAASDGDFAGHDANDEAEDFDLPVGGAAGLGVRAQLDFLSAGSPSPSVPAPTPSPEPSVSALHPAASSVCLLARLSPSSTGDDPVAATGGLGCVKLALDFNFKSSVLLVHVIECRDLPLGDARRQRTDCYVKLCLLPDQTHKAKRRTKIRKNSQSPIFDERLKYCITLSDLETRKLHVSAWHSADLLQSDVLLGELEIPMNLNRLQSKDAVWYSFHQLAPSLELQLAHSKYVGEVTLSLKYVTPDHVNITDINQVTGCSGELRIWVKEARNLPSTRMGLQAADPYVKLCLLPDRSPRGKRKTPPVQKSCSPVWNLVLKFENLSVSQLRTRALELTIWDNYRLMPGKRVFLGGLLLEADSSSLTMPASPLPGSRPLSPRSPARLSDETKMWKTVMERHNVWIDGTLLLRPAMPSSRLMSD